MTNLESLRALLESGQFHHATYRNQGTLWEGLWIYGKSEGGFGGYEPLLTFLANDPDLERAHDMVRHTGVSVGSFGNG